MARVAWVFDGWSFPINPSDDSAWTTELVLAEKVPIGAPRSRFQYGGSKSDMRQVEGWIWGPESDEMYSNFRNWQKNRTQADLTDHLGETRRCFIVDFKPTLVQDVKSWANGGRQTYRYQMTFRAVD